MKKLIFITFALITFLFIGIYNVNAEEISTLNKLRTCLSTDGSTCTLTEDIEVSSESIETKGKTTLDLNGHAIKPASGFAFTGGIVIVNYGSTLTVNDTVGSGKITGGETKDVYAAITLTKKGTTDTDGPANLIVNEGTLEGYYYAVSGNGNRHNTNVTINGGTLKALSGTGIYNPQNGNVTINGGSIIASDTGIEIRSGKLAVTGGSIVATYIPTEVNGNGNGTTTSGAAIAVAQHNTKQPIEVNISGGDFKAYTPFNQSNPQENSAEDISKIKLNITGGTFTSTGTNAVYSENFEKYISGGTFNKTVPEKYIVEGKNQKSNGVVSDIVYEQGITIPEVNTTKEVSEPTFGISNTSKASEIILKSINTTKEVDVTDKNIDVAVKINEIEVDENTSKTLTKKLETITKDATIVGYFDITLDVIDTDTNNLLGHLTELTDKIEFTVVLPENLQKVKDGYTRQFYIVKQHGNDTEIIDANLSDGGKSITFATDKFSTFMLGYKDIKDKSTSITPPKTIDNLMLYGLIGLIAAIGIIFGYKYLKKYSN